MPDGQRDLAGVSAGVLVTCEHASNAIPRELGTLGLPRRVLRSHIAWDPGARETAAALASRLGVPVIVSRCSRLVVDVNRSLHNRTLIPATAFGVAVPGNRGLTSEQRRRRITRYYEPYRDRVDRAVVAEIEIAGRCQHLAVHTFVPRLAGVTRRADIGILYDPRREGERWFAGAVIRDLATHGLVARRNYPYRGTADGFTTWLRQRLPPDRYRGIEIEVNQRLVRHTASARRLGRLLADGVARALRT